MSGWSYSRSHEKGTEIKASTLPCPPRESGPQLATHLGVRGLDVLEAALAPHLTRSIGRAPCSRMGEWTHDRTY
jgi:hypothetical protein